ncbi:MAG: hypothetical protein ABI282_09995 [Candidatus Baltobacteraceae bacterium]
MHHFTRFLGVGICAGLLASCSPNGGSAVPAGSGSDPIAATPASWPAVTPSLHSAISNPKVTGISGTVTGMKARGGFTVYTGPSYGYVPVSSSSAPGNPGSLAVGKFTIVTGTGSTGTLLTPTFIAVFSSNPGLIALTGTVTGTTSFGFDLRSSPGVVPIMVSSATSGGSVSTGQTVTVEGIGSTGVGILASSVQTGSGTPTPDPTSTPPPGVPAHVLTADWLGSPYGSSVSPSAAAPYLTWAGTSPSNGDSFHAAGLKVESYTDPNRIQSGDPLYNPSSLAKTCAGAYVTYDFSGHLQYIGNPASSSLRSDYRSYVQSMQAQGHIDAVFEDNAGALDNGGSFLGFSGIPCGYTSSGWVNADAALEGNITVPTIFNGLSSLDGHNLSLSLGLFQNASTIGGTFEHCFTDDSQGEMAAWEWQDIENSQIQTVGKSRIFQCMARNTSEASSQTRARIYTMASLLLTYSPNFSVLWEGFGTPSNFHVFPESRLVALQPLVSQPSDISSLSRGGNYIREYRACYISGKSAGPCAVVVNSDYYSTYSIPSLSYSYHHSLALSGNGVLDGGSISTSGSVPSSLPPQNATILFQ